MREGAVPPGLAEQPVTRSFGLPVSPERQKQSPSSQVAPGPHNTNEQTPAGMQKYGAFH